MRIHPVLLCLCLCACNAQTSRSYSTNFPLTENPISDGGTWINGATTGIEWGNVSTTPGEARGNENLPHGDSEALVSGVWNPDQTAQATVFVTGTPSISCGQEVELRLRSTISGNRSTGYEISYSSTFGDTIIVRWNGPIGDFTILKIFSDVTVRNGDVVQATVVGSTIRAYKNGILLGQVTDGTFATGSPGIGMNYTPNNGCTTAEEANYGFASFSAVSSSSPSRP